MGVVIFFAGGLFAFVMLSLLIHADAEPPVPPTGGPAGSFRRCPSAGDDPTAPSGIRQPDGADPFEEFDHAWLRLHGIQP
jgi:hypothetical protein